MAALEVVNLRDGEVVDRVALRADGRLNFETGAAWDLFEVLRSHSEGLTDAELFEARTGWSNGYVAIRQADTQPPTPPPQ